jgi:hypothetical protein
VARACILTAEWLPLPHRGITCAHRRCPQAEALKLAASGPRDRWLLLEQKVERGDVSSWLLAAG